MDGVSVFVCLAQFYKNVKMTMESCWTQAKNVYFLFLPKLKFPLDATANRKNTNHFQFSLHILK